MSSEWTVLYRYIAPIDPDYGGAPFKLTLWRDNLGGLVLGMDERDGEKVNLAVLSPSVAEDLALAMLESRS